jgi:hypothetical protein
VIPVPHGEKEPVLPKWQELRLQADDLPRYFNGQPMNIGMLNGEPSGWVSDVDLDAMDALALADRFLPPTGASFGRPGKPKSHRLYTCEIATEKFADVDKRSDEPTAMIVEIRSTGSQTIIPPSVHPSGEAIAWSSDGQPARVQSGDLRRAVVHLACAALLARHWPPKGSRHEAALAAAGLLVRAGLDDVVTVQIVTSVARLAGEDDHKRDVLDTIAAIRSGEPATGGPRLAELLTGDAEKVVNRLRGWLGVGVVVDDGGLHATDTGNAERFRLLHGADARYCYSLRAWHWWDGQRFVRDQGDRVMAAAKRIPGTIYAAASRQTDVAARTALAAWAKKSEQESRLRALAFLAQSEPGIPVSVERLDADGWGLNTPSGMVDLRTGHLRPARREDYCTKVTAAAYDPRADSPQWREFLVRIFDGNARLIEFVQRAIARIGPS